MLKEPKYLSQRATVDFNEIPIQILLFKTILTTTFDRSWWYDLLTTIAGFPGLGRESYGELKVSESPKVSRSGRGFEI